MARDIILLVNFYLYNFIFIIKYFKYLIININLALINQEIYEELFRFFVLFILILF
jgi:hypothetical protein